MRALGRHATRAAARVGAGRRVAVSLAIVAGLLLTAPAFGQSKLATDAKQKLEQDRQRLKQTEQRASQLKSDLAKIEEERARLNAQLQEAARSVQDSEARLSSIEARRDALEVQRKQHQEALQQRHAEISKLLGAMQRMSRNPPPVIVTRREDALEMVRSAMLLARAVPELQTQVQDLVGRLKELENLFNQIAEERRKIESETQQLKNAQARLAMLMEEKRQSQSHYQAELEAVRREADRISKSVTSLSELIAALDQTVAERTGLGTYEKQLPKEGAGPPGKAGPGKSGDGEIDIVLAPAGPLSGPPGRLKPAIPFHLAKGKLPMPAHGRPILGFGDITSSGRRSQGIVIETRPGAQITSPTDGWVVYAGEFRSYGQLLIINAGGGYHVLLAGLSHIDAQLGQFVLAGEPVGTMQVAPAGRSQENAPVLYVEFRKEGRPIDPTPWWYRESEEKVQG
nr:MAG: peptidase M23 [Pseudomonadota bacterium]